MLCPTRSSSTLKRSTGRSSATSQPAVLPLDVCLQGAGGRGDLRQLAVLGRKLCGRGYLHLLHVAERTLGEGREPAQRLDLDVEHVDPHRPLLGRREHVEQSASQRELSPLLHLVDPLVAGRHKVLRALLEIEQLADAQSERMRAQLGSGTFSESATALTTTTGASPVPCGPSAHRGPPPAARPGGAVGSGATHRRRRWRGTSGPGAAKPGAQIGCQVAGGAVVPATTSVGRGSPRCPRRR